MRVVLDTDYYIKIIFNGIGATKADNSNNIDLYDVGFILLLEYNK